LGALLDSAFPTSLHRLPETRDETRQDEHDDRFLETTALASPAALRLRSFATIVNPVMSRMSIEPMRVGVKEKLPECRRFRATPLKELPPERR
jgi:hypothetical protein